MALRGGRLEVKLLINIFETLVLPGAGFRFYTGSNGASLWGT